jgi:hypothetical protein
MCLALTMMAANCWPQAEPPATPAVFYRLDFVLKELEGAKTINSRAYMMTISTDKGSFSSIRTGSRVPVPAKDGTYTYMEVGINFDCRLAKESGNDLTLNVSADISSVPDSSSGPPVVRNTKLVSNVIVPFRKPTTIFLSDDAMSKRQIQLDLTAAPIK